MKDVFIVGSKGIPANYGGFETFVDNLVSRRKSKEINYYVACMTLEKKKKHYNYHGAECQEISIPNIGGAKALLYDLKALDWALRVIQKRNLHDGLVYILACRVGPFINKYVKRFHKYGFRVLINPDGHEWKRAKWSAPVRKYWKTSERLMVKNSDLLICDSISIEKYINEDYKKYYPKTKFIAYGADIEKSKLKNNDLEVKNWYTKNNVLKNEYFLIVGRFVPENNYGTMIKEFMASTIQKDLVLITNVEQNDFYEKLKKQTHFDTDPRIKFVGTVYDAELLKYIRENAYGYLHGHSVGGTNPSLLEALGSTKLNLLFDVGFNKEVARNSAIYWTKEYGNLRKVLETSVHFSSDEIKTFQKRAKKRVLNNYSWDKIVDEYETLFSNMMG